MIPGQETGECSLPASLADSTMDRMVEKAAWVREGAATAGRDPASIELNTMVFRLAVGADAAARRDALARDNGVAVADLGDSTLFLTGTGPEVRDRLLEYRGLSNIHDPATGSYLTVSPREVQADPTGVAGDERFGVAVAEVSTGEFRVGEIGATEVAGLLHEFPPRELLLPEGLTLPASDSDPNPSFGGASRVTRREPARFDPRAVPRGARRAGVRLRHLPGRVPVEPRHREAQARRTSGRGRRAPRFARRLVARGRR